MFSDEHRKCLSDSHKGKVFSNDSRRRMSESNSGEKHYLYGKHHSEETKEKMRAAKIGKPISDETRAKMSKAHKDLYLNKLCSVGIKNKRYNGCTGKHHSEATKKKISEANIGKHHSYETKMLISASCKKALLSEEVRNKIRVARRNQILPFKDTKIEVALQNKLLLSEIFFEKHKNILGQPDIFIAPNVCIFCDGAYWHADPRLFKAEDIMYGGIVAQQIWNKDNRITKKLESDGYLVLRFWEREIMGNTDDCMHIILQNVGEKI